MKSLYRTMLLLAAAMSFVPLLGAEGIPIDVEGYGGFAASPTKDSVQGPLLDYGGILTYGGGINVRWMPQLSTLVSATTAVPNARIIDVPNAPDFFNVGTARTTPIALIVQWHFLGNRGIDPYVGAGGTWILASNVQLPSFVPGGTPVRSIDLDDKAAFVADAGVRFRLFGPVGLLMDGRYIPLHLDGTAHFDGGLPDLPLRFTANQFLVNLGLSLRF